MADFLSPVAGLIDIVRSLLGGWSEQEINYYFELTMRTEHFAVAVRTNDRVAARAIANGVADYMRQLREADRRSLGPGRPLLGD